MNTDELSILRVPASRAGKLRVGLPSGTPHRENLFICVYPCSSVVNLLSCRYAAATGSRFLPIDSAETVLLQTGQCHSSTGGSLPSRWTLWNLARLCLQTCLGATCHLLSATSLTG